jgi:hypothetical protein
MLTEMGEGLGAEVKTLGAEDGPLVCIGSTFAALNHNHCFRKCLECTGVGGNSSNTVTLFGCSAANVDLVLPRLFNGSADARNPRLLLWLWVQLQNWE